jgi:predicted DNA-binding antitoxin AbrB/MazE fold protein
MLPPVVLKRKEYAMQTVVEVIYDGEVLRPERPLRLKHGTSYAVIIDEPAEAPLDADALSATAWKFYNDTLKQCLEPGHNGQVVAIHTTTLDYEVALNSPRAWKALRKRQPDGKIMVLDIGIVPTHNALTALQAAKSLGYQDIADALIAAGAKN